MSAARPAAHAPERGAAARGQSWVVLLALYGFASFVEAFGVSQVFAFMLLYL